MTHARLFRGRLLLLCFVAAVFSTGEARAQTTPPVLLSEPDSTRAMSLESVSRAPEPYTPDSTVQWGPARRTPVEVFAMNLAPVPNERLSAMPVGAADAFGRAGGLEVEHVAPATRFARTTGVA